MQACLRPLKMMMMMMMMMMHESEALQFRLWMTSPHSYLHNLLEILVLLGW